MIKEFGITAAILLIFIISVAIKLTILTGISFFAFVIFSCFCAFYYKGKKNAVIALIPLVIIVISIVIFLSQIKVGSVSEPVKVTVQVKDVILFMILGLISVGCSIFFSLTAQNTPISSKESTIISPSKSEE